MIEQLDFLWLLVRSVEWANVLLGIAGYVVLSIALRFAFSDRKRHAGCPKNAARNASFSSSQSSSSPT